KITCSDCFPNLSYHIRRKLRFQRDLFFEYASARQKIIVSTVGQYAIRPQDVHLPKWALCGNYEYLFPRSALYAKLERIFPKGQVFNRTHAKRTPCDKHERFCLQQSFCDKQPAPT